MNVQILDAAEEDLVEGYWFYEAQQPGLGAYFRDSIYADVQALEKTAGVHRVVYKDYIAHLRRAFPSHCTTRFRDRQRSYERSSIAGAIQHGSENTCNNFVSARALNQHAKGSSCETIAKS